jgi:hypothetical protein
VTSDPFHLAETDPGLKAWLGATPLGAALVNGKLDEKLNDLPRARLSLSTTLLAGQPLDYFGTVAVQLGGRDSPRFTGNVVSAAREGDEVQLDCMTHPSLRERRISVFEAINGDAREIMHLMTRSGGLSEDLVNIGGIEDLPLEMIEVLIPLVGVSVSQTVRLGHLTLLDPAVSAPLLSPFSSEEGREEFASADCHALYRSVARRMYDVETLALAEVEAVLSWASTRARYGLTHLPRGQTQTFVRARALSRPRRGEFSVARGLDSGRTWLRGLAQSDPGEVIDLASNDWLPPAPESLSDAQRLSLAALRSAVDADDPLVRVQALFQAVEFYVAGVTTSARFDKTEARRIRRSIPKDIDPELRERALSLFAKLNEPPLMAKLRAAARRDGVPLTEAEIELLSRIRGARNGTVHGRPTDAPNEDELNYAVSVVARLLLFGLARRP